MHELTIKRIETEKSDKARIANAVSAAEVFFLPLFCISYHPLQSFNVDF